MDPEKPEKSPSNQPASTGEQPSPVEAFLPACTPSSASAPDAPLGRPPLSDAEIANLLARSELGEVGVQTPEVSAVSLAFADLPASTVVAPDNSAGQHRFSLLELFIAITVASLCLALFRAIGIYGALVSFVLAAIFTVHIYPRQRPDSPYRQGLMFDFVWGCVMPIICLMFDPMVFKEDMQLLVVADLFQTSPVEQREEENRPGAAPLASTFDKLIGGARIHDTSFLVYSLLAGQVLMLGISLWAGSLRGPLCAVMAGWLLVGAISSLVIAIALVLPATIGVAVLGLGVLGFTPWFTARSYFRAAMRAYEQVHPKGEPPQLWSNRIWALVGILLSIILPLTGGVVLLGAVRGVESVERIFLL